MKALLLLLTAGLCHAAPRTLTWEPGDPTALVLFYTVKEKLGPGLSVIGTAVGTSHTFEVSPGPHTYIVTATVGDIESGESEEIHRNEPAPPKNLRIALQISHDMQTWTTVAEHDPGDVPRVFARAVFAD